MTTKDDQGNVIQVVEFEYDIFDRRIAKIVDADGAGSGVAETSSFVYDGQHIALVFNSAGSLTHRYVHGPQIDQILADEQLTPGQPGPGNVLWAMTDHLGTVRDIVNSAGNVVNHISYTSFGELVGMTNPNVEFAFDYTGREFDTEIGLQFNRARYYDPHTGQFLGEDPIRDDFQNLFRYVGNGVLTATDPSGLASAVGHHWMPVTLVKRFRSVISDSARDVALGLYSGPTEPSHRFSKEHFVYNEKVADEFKKFQKLHGITEKKPMTGEQMRTFVGHMEKGMDHTGKNPAVPEIRDFNAAVKKAVIPGQVVSSEVDDATLIKRGQAFADRNPNRMRGLCLAGAMASMFGLGVGNVGAATTETGNSKEFWQAMEHLSDGEFSSAKKELFGEGGNHKSPSGGLFEKLATKPEIGLHGASNFLDRLGQAIEAIENGQTQKGIDLLKKDNQTEEEMNQPEENPCCCLEPLMPA